MTVLFLKTNSQVCKVFKYGHIRRKGYARHWKELKLTPRKGCVYDHIPTYTHNTHTLTHSPLYYLLFAIQSGRKLVKRSAPPVMKRKHAEQQEKRSKEEEELQYFFS